MANSFLNLNEKSWFESSLETWFETFKRPLIVHKEPLKNIIQNTTNQMLGYEENSNIVDYSYTPRNQTFDAVIKYNPTDNLIQDQEIKLQFTNQIVEVFVKEDAKKYIETDKTEKITFDNKDFNIVSTSIAKNYFSKTYYVYYLKETR